MFFGHLRIQNLKKEQPRILHYDMDDRSDASGKH